MAIEDEVAKDKSGLLTEQIRQRAAQIYDQTRALDAQRAAQQSMSDVAQQIAAAKEQIAINEKLIAGEIDLAEAIRRRAVAQENARRLAAGLPPLVQEEIDAYRELADTQDALAKSTQRAADATFDLGQSFSDNLAKVIEGIALGTNKGMSLMEGLSRAIKTTWASMLSAMIKNKLEGFDFKISANFLQVIPGIINRGLSLIKGAWSSAFASLAGQTQQQASPYGGGIGQYLTGLVNLGKSAGNYIGGLFGGGGGAMGSAAAGARATGGGFGAGITGVGGGVSAGLGSGQGPSVAGSGTTTGGGGMGAAGWAGIIALVISVVTSIVSGISASMKLKYGTKQEQVEAGYQGLKNAGIIGQILSWMVGGRSGMGALAGTKGEDKQWGAMGMANVFLGAGMGQWMGLFAKQLYKTEGTRFRESFAKFLKKSDVPYFGKGDDYMFPFHAGRFVPAVSEIMRRPGPPGWGAEWGQFGTNEQYNDSLKEFIENQRVSLGLSERQTKQFMALGAVFRASVSQDKNTGIPGGWRLGLSSVAALLDSLTKAGATAAEAMEVVGDALQKIGPRRAFTELAQWFTATQQSAAADALSVKEYTDAVEGLAQVFFTDLPLGVRTADAVMQEFAENGIVRFEALSTRIAELGMAAELLAPSMQDIFTAALMGETGANINLGAQAFAGIMTQLREMTAQAVGDGIIQAGLDPNVLQPFIHTMNETMAKLSAGEITRGEAVDIMKLALADAKNAMLELQPFIDDLIAAGRELGSVFTDAGDSVLSLAMQIAQLEDAQRAFNDMMDARIYALRNQGQASPEIIRHRLPDIQREYELMMEQFFSTALAQPGGMMPRGIGRKGEVPRWEPRAGGKGEQLPWDKYAVTEQLAAIDKMRALAEEYLATEIAAIEAERDAAIAAHQERINALQIELEAVQKAAQTAAAWKSVMDQIGQTILSMRTGAASPEAPLGRLQIAQQEFARQQAILRDRGASDAARQAAAQQLTALGPQILELMAQAGIAQSSEQYRIAFAGMLSALDEANKIAAEKGARAEALAERALAIQEQIAAEQRAIVAVQESAKTEIAKVSAAVADQLEWLRDKGNALFAAKQDELKAKLAALGVTSVDMADIQAESLVQLYRIAALIEAQGSKVVGTPAFATGGLVRYETLARLAEANRPELVLPLNPADRSIEAQRAFAALAQHEFGGRFGARPLDAARPLPPTRDTSPAAPQRGSSTVQQSVTINLTVAVQATVDLSDKQKLQAQLTPVFTDMLSHALTTATMRAKVARVARTGTAATPRI